MILFGYRSSRLDIVEDNVCRCPRCNGGPMAHNIFKQYFHIWYIPIFPFNKKIISKCMSCGAEIDQRELPPGTKEQVMMSSMKRTPFWMYSGLIIIAVVIVWTGVSSMIKSRKVSSYETEYSSSYDEGDVDVVEEDTYEEESPTYDDDYGPASPDGERSGGASSESSKPSR